MKRFFAMSMLAASMVTGVLAIGCSQEVAHKETDSPNLMGGHTHEETTTYKNPDGSYSTENSKQRTN
jgi:hypothetical protein